MAMSKKHYQALARMLHRIQPDLDSAQNQVAAERQLVRHGMWETVVFAIADDVLAQDNPRFDRARFLEACNTGTTKGMR